MIEIKDFPGNNIIEVHISKKLHGSDYDQLMPVIDEKVKKYNKANLLWVMHNFDGWDAKAFFKDLEVDLKHARNFEKIALTGEKKWHHLMAKIMRPFTSAEVKYFDYNQLDEAKVWIAEK